LPVSTQAAADCLSLLELPKGGLARSGQFGLQRRKREMENEDEHYWNESIKTFLKRKRDRIGGGPEIWGMYRRQDSE
jgi:hypothetical protein